MTSPTILAQRYQLEGVLGEGGMGRVYRARHLRLNRTVAVKALLNQSGSEQEASARLAQFEAEAQILAGLDHPALVHVLDFFEQDGVHYLVMEFVEGKTLTQVLGLAPKPISQRRVLQWAEELLDVLEYLHSQSPPIILKDLKPDNVMLTSEGRLKVIDFGIAKRLIPTGGTMDIAKGVGTEEYAPLEQYGNGSTDQRSDLYSLGATLYFALTQQAPVPAWKRAVKGDKLPDPRNWNTTVEGPLVEALDRLTALLPQDRPDSAGDARRLLGQKGSGYGIKAGEVPTARTEVKRSMTASLKGTQQLAQPSGQPRVIAWFPRQPWFMAGGTVWDLKARKAVYRFADSARVTSSTVSPDQRWLAVGGAGGDIQLLDAGSGKLVQQIASKAWLRSDPVRGLRFLPGSQTLFALSEAQHLTSYNLQGEKLLTYRPTTSWLSLSGCRLKSFDVGASNLVAAGGSDGTVFVWEARTARLLWTAQHSEDVQAVAFSADGVFLASASLDQSMRLWQTETGLPLNQFPHSEPLRALAWSPDGRVLASGGETGLVRLWDLARATELARFQSSGRVSQLTFHERTLAAAWSDGVIKLYELSW